MKIRAGKCPANFSEHNRTTAQAQLIPGLLERHGLICQYCFIAIYLIYSTVVVMHI